MLPKKEQGIILLSLTIVILATIVALVASLIFLQRNQTSSVKGIIAKLKPTPIPSPWKTYKNEEYKFEITYPRVGVIYTKDGFGEGECGYAIKMDGANLLVDNFYKLKIVNWETSLEEYLSSQGALRSYETEEVLDSGADEGVKLLRLKDGFEIAVGYPPLAYVKAVFKKGEKTFLIQEIIHNPTNVSGCVLPSVVDPTRYPEVAKINWDVVKSIKFL